MQVQICLTKYLNTIYVFNSDIRKLLKQQILLTRQSKHSLKENNKFVKKMTLCEKFKIFMCYNFI